MAQSVREIMTPNPKAMPAESSVVDAARVIRDEDIGDVIVLKDDEICGIVTDRDIVVRAVAEGREPSQVKLEEICSSDLTTLSPSDTVEEAIRRMREKAIRRLPVVENGKPVGIVSLGDLAMERDPESALADISEAPPDA
jgi:CBS domain-containing protein